MLRKFLILFCVSSIWASSLKPAKDLGPRIINGDDAVLGQLPWQVALRVDTETEGSLCGGAIINEEWILTAAHCVTGDVQSITVTVGSVTWPNSDNEYSASQHILHENYNSSPNKDDIALVKLSKPLTFNDNIQPIALASDDLGTGVDVTVSGWGQTKDNGTVANNLKYITLKSITKEECEPTYGGSGAIFDTMICFEHVGNTVQGPCHGDSGGGAVADASSNPVHVAVACIVDKKGCETGAPALFTRTASYRDWIKTKSGV